MQVSLHSCARLSFSADVYRSGSGKRAILTEYTGLVGNGMDLEDMAIIGKQFER